MTLPNTHAGPTPRAPDRPLVILGASVRSLAESAHRAGWAVHAADLFCDLDVQAIATKAVSVANDHGGDGGSYPWSLGAAAATFPPTAVWCYTGALENHPDLVDAIAATRPLAGNSGAVLRRLRDPAEAAAAAAAAGLAFPETHLSPVGLPLDGSFLIKPLAGAGGRGIRRWTPEVASDHGRRHADGHHSDHIWQRFETGVAVSAAYCLTQGAAQFLGLSRQLIGEPWCHAGRFAWCGAVTLGPRPASPEYDRLTAGLQRLGEVLSSQFHAIGLVGVDLVVDAARRLVVIEINPRPTASMELFERSGVCSIAERHLSSCGLSSPTTLQAPVVPTRAAPVWAKAVLFVEQATPVSATLIDAIRLEAEAWTQADGGWPALADIPSPGQTLPAGGPAVTLFAAGLTADDAIAAVRDRVARIKTLMTATGARTTDV